MSEKRYQVFVSSTFRDLDDERKKVAQALLGMDCIPAGMELFPAIDEEQFEFIKKVIDDCDYYVLILGGRYGSLTSDGISYTEKEFDYALEVNIRILVFLHENPDSLSVEKSEIDPTSRERLRAFRERASTGRLVKTWKSSDELPGLVALSLMKTIKTYPAPGWVRQTGQSSEELLLEINNLRKQREAMEAELGTLRAARETEPEALASGEDQIAIHGHYYPGNRQGKFSWQATITWDHIFYHIGPHLYKYESDFSVGTELAKAILRVDQEKTLDSAYLAEDSLHTLRVQFEALGYVTVQALSLQKGGEGIFWRLTPKGKRKVFLLRLVKKDDAVSKVGEA